MVRGLINMHQIRVVLGESHDDDINDLLNEVQAENGLGVDTSSGGNIDRSDDIENESLGALGILAGNRSEEVKYCAGLIARVERKLTEGWYRTSYPRC